MKFPFRLYSFISLEDAPNYHKLEVNKIKLQFWRKFSFHSQDSKSKKSKKKLFENKTFEKSIKCLKYYQKVEIITYIQLFEMLFRSKITNLDLKLKSRKESKIFFQLSKSPLFKYVDSIKILYERFSDLDMHALSKGMYYLRNLRYFHIPITSNIFKRKYMTQAMLSISGILEENVSILKKLINLERFNLVCSNVFYSLDLLRKFTECLNLKIFSLVFQNRIENCDIFTGLACLLDLNLIRTFKLQSNIFNIEELDPFMKALNRSKGLRILDLVFCIKSGDIIEKNLIVDKICDSLPDQLVQLKFSITSDNCFNSYHISLVNMFSKLDNLRELEFDTSNIIYSNNNYEPIIMVFSQISHFSNLKILKIGSNINVFSIENIIEILNNINSVSSLKELELSFEGQNFSEKSFSAEVISILKEKLNNSQKIEKLIIFSKAIPVCIYCAILGCYLFLHEVNIQFERDKFCKFSAINALQFLRTISNLKILLKLKVKAIFSIETLKIFEKIPLKYKDILSY